MPTKQIGIDLDDFDVDDIIDHLEYEHLTKDEVLQLLAIVLKHKDELKGTKLSEVYDLVDVDVETDWPIVTSLADQYKRQAVVDAWDRLSQS